MTWLQCRDRNWLGFCVEVQKYLFLMCEYKLTWFLSGGIEIDMILQWGSIRHDFSIGVEINLILVWGFEFDLFLVLGSNLTCFLCEGSKLTVCGPKLSCFECDDRLTWFMGGWWWSKLTRILDTGPKSLGFSASIEIDLVLSGWSILAWFQCGGSNVVDIGLISVWGIKRDLISV